MRLAEAHGCRFVTPPQGLFGWVDVGTDTEALALTLADEVDCPRGSLVCGTTEPAQVYTAP